MKFSCTVRIVTVADISEKNGWHKAKVKVLVPEIKDGTEVLRKAEMFWCNYSSKNHQDIVDLQIKTKQEEHFIANLELRSFEYSTPSKGTQLGMTLDLKSVKR